MNKKSILLGIIIGAIFFLPLGIFAAISYDASQINYKSTTLDHAIDELYTTQNTTVTNLNNQLTTMHNKFDRMQVLVKGESSTANVGWGTLAFTNFIKNNYKYFKVTGMATYGNSASCELRAYSAIRADMVNINANTQYKVYDATDNYQYEVVQFASKSTGNAWSSCEGVVTFYNVSEV